MVKDIGNFSSGRLSCSSDDSLDGVDGRQKGVLVKVGGGIGLEGVVQSVVEIVDVGNEKDVEEDEDVIDEGDGVGYGFDMSDIR